MTYKMIVLDMDGTLLNEEQEISDANKSILLKAKEEGYHIVLASGRHFNGLLPYIRELGLDEPGCFSVSCSGAMVVANDSHEVIYEEHVDMADVRLLHETCEKLDIDMCCYSTEGLLIHHDNLFTRYDCIANQAPLIKVDFNTVDETIYKLNIINESDEIAQEIIDFFPSMTLEDYSVRHKETFNPDLLDELWRFPESIREKYNIVRPLPFFVEVFHKHSNKAVGVEVITEKLGISMSEVVAIGDSGNDVHMIEEAGLGVAMANARDEAKAVADYITDSNCEDGVAKVMEKILKNERFL